READLPPQAGPHAPDFDGACTCTNAHARAPDAAGAAAAGPGASGVSAATSADALDGPGERRGYSVARHRARDGGRGRRGGPRSPDRCVLALGAGEVRSTAGRGPLEPRSGEPGPDRGWPAR